MNVQAPEVILIGAVVFVLIFGAKKLPEIARSMGRAKNEFKKGLKEGEGEPANAQAPAEARHPEEVRRAETAE